jgi:beta-galactosidase
MPSRRKFLEQTVTLGLSAFAAPNASGAEASNVQRTEISSLCGKWLFRTDRQDIGRKEGWFETPDLSGDWQEVDVPHTWQIIPNFVDYYGVAWYRRSFNVPAEWSNSAIRVEFEAVFHSATVWVNRQLAGEHIRKGYTAFTFDITRLLRWGTSNELAVRVDNAFNEHMLPRGHSSDWAHDGGIFRPVQLLVTPKTYLERVDIDAIPDLTSGDANLTIHAYTKNVGLKPWSGVATFHVRDEQTRLSVVDNSKPKSFSINPGELKILTLEAVLAKAKLWNFDHPNLYQLDFSIGDHRGTHQFAVTFGVRKLEVKNGRLHLNGEQVRLMGVERMAGSNPEFGMAEPVQWIAHDHADIKNLNCVFTRVHWPQDRRVLDHCDRMGILLQSEVPAWGADTFGGMGTEPDRDILENGLEQLREMIARDGNHPSVVIWGLCNEIDGQNPPASRFAKSLLEEAKRLDPNRLCSYASNSLLTHPERDVAGLMDIIEANEYFGTWAPGTIEDLAQHLDTLHATFPGKPIVISEYGYCACTPDRPEGDEHRAEVLRTHTTTFRSKDFISGAIFFCYNDYRTHAGDRGVGALQQRVHGAVDIYGAPKLSYDLLRHESSPIESVTIENDMNTFHLRIRTRRDIPSYPLRGYSLRGVFYGQGNIPVEEREIELPEMAPGTEISLRLAFTRTETPMRIQFDVLRPARFSAYTLDWKP